MANPEQRGQEEIDRLLTAAGWHVCDAEYANIHAARRVSSADLPLPGYGFADYLFYLDGKAAATCPNCRRGGCRRQQNN